MSVLVSKILRHVSTLSSLNSDNFNSYTNNISLEDTGNWEINHYNTLQDGLRIINPTGTSGKARVYNLSSTAMTYTPVGTFTNNHYSQFTVATLEVAYNYIGVIVRGTPGTAHTGTCYIWQYSPGGDGVSKFAKRIDGTHTTISSTGTAWVVGDIIRLAITGSELSFYRNGSLDTSIVTGGTYTNNEITTGKPGVWAWGLSDASDISFDNWEGANI